jgi:hypothetical protein
MGSLCGNKIGNAGARGAGLGAALQVNTTLTTLKWGRNVDVNVNVDDTGVSQLWWQKGSPHNLGQCSHLHMGSLDHNSIGDEGARDLGAALRVNAALTTLRWECCRNVDV